MRSVPLPRQLSALIERITGDNRSLQSLLHGSALVLVMQVVGIGLAYGMQVVVARWAGPFEFGVFAYAWTWMNLLLIVGAFGLSDAALRLIPQYAAHRSWAPLHGLVVRGPVLIVGLACVLGMIAAGVVLLLGDHVGPAYRTPLLLTFAAAPLFGLLSFGQGVGRALNSVFAAFLPRYIGLPTLVIAAVIAFAILGIPLNAANLMIATIAAGLLLLLFQAAALYRNVPAEARHAAAQTPVRNWMRLSVSLLSIGICYALLTHCDLLMVGFLLNPTDVAVYQAASRTAALIAFPLTALNALVAPMIARLHAEHRPDELQRTVVIATQVIFWPSLLAAIVLTAGGELILHVFGPAFDRGHLALVILVAGQLVTAAVGPVTSMLTMTGHERSCMTVFAITVTGQFLINLILIPQLGIEGAAIGTMLANCFLSAALTVIVRQRLHISAHALVPLQQMLAKAKVF